MVCSIGNGVGFGSTEDDDGRRPEGGPAASPVDPQLETPGCLSITQGNTSQVGQKGRGFGAEDWFEWSLWVDWKQARFEGFVDKLANIKDVCKRERKPFEWLDLGEIKYSGWAAVSVMITAISPVK